MRKRGIPEEKITGDSSNRSKWDALASVFPSFAGNPTYEWIHLDLKRQFQIEEIISSTTADKIWEISEDCLNDSAMLPQALLETMDIEVMCTTDDPTTRLPNHEQAAQEIVSTKIFPTWRPDKAMNIDTPLWRGLLERLEEETGEQVSNLQGFLNSLQATHDYFSKLGCVASDHGVYEPYSHFVSEAAAAAIHDRAFQGRDLSKKEVKDYKAFMLNRFGEMNVSTGWVTQLHIGPVRDYRDSLSHGLGPDSGGDISSQRIDIVDNLSPFLNEFDGRLEVVLYCVDPTHLPTLATIARAFPNVSLGAAWWWNDSPYGMETQLKYIATVDLLANYAGMVTDSRKLISFGSRTEMFRRVLCNVIGKMMERGQIPEGPAGDLVRSLSYDRPKKLFF
jgi:glucuronate isomerase